MQLVDKSELFVFNRESTRTGVIPYTYINGEPHWLMGLSVYDGLVEPRVVWSDFGGGCEIRKGERPIDCLLRETDEESSSVLTRVVEDAIVNDNPSVWKLYSRRGNLTGFFVLVEIPYDQYWRRFTPNEEVVALVWLPQSEVLSPEIAIEKFHQPIQRIVQEFRDHCC